MKKFAILLGGALLTVFACGHSQTHVTPDQITLTKDLLYDQHTLADQYPYGQTTRSFQWDKIKAQLAAVESAQSAGGRWGVLVNHRNEHGQPALVYDSHTDEYHRPADQDGTERYQGIPLYNPADSVRPVLYGQDGAWVRVLSDNGRWTELETIYETGKGRYRTPSAYVHEIAEGTSLRKICLADRTMQNICTLEKQGDFRGSQRTWLIRSMNPCTTGAHNPPYQHPTPLGFFVVQEKKEKMFFTGDGSSAIAGFCPYASRFSDGGYMHGVPVNYPRQTPIEFSATLGTIPRSHMCIRNATSHAEFIYNWAPVDNALVVVIE